ncbi:hypothetical protein DFR89_003211 [Clostridium beijerinckii]|uniref:hypothetical protein n=1 Tax=Clostridium beijerinckii TaxID=1520 RepID=UPI00040FA1E6|nr:hypothetical protein [Clostridium beijerinckii]NRT05162.1 hypothetical protein [Clostridium beijerinckii]NRV53624.1 hypothetical protein [Clostridium beijerinckii]NRV78562.1 hypothetical protein [Clostridium beijerinckii]NRX09007.1 hypothetical protein [Clostridium beijerinckii]NRZ43497.1 hypothetical protein [Clostridium beijerinckii]
MKYIRYAKIVGVNRYPNLKLDLCGTYRNHKYFVPKSYENITENSKLQVSPL